MRESLFNIRDVTYEYEDGTKALLGISLSIKKGRKIALLGNNGAGKSTFLLHLNGLLKPTSGVIYFQESPISYKRKDVQALRKKVGMVFQDSDTQLFSASVFQDIAFGPHNTGMSHAAVVQAVEKAMEETDTQDLKGKPTHFLSFGQKKRVAIAGVLAMNPDVLVLDEPTAGLDPYYAKQIMGILHTVHNQGKTIILSTHDVQFAYEWADDVIVMNNGEILIEADPQTVFQREDILQKSHLEKPWIMEVYELLEKNSLIKPGTRIPKTKKELFAQIGKDGDIIHSS